MWVALLSGVAVAASCGLRAFLPLLVLGLAARAGVIELRGGAEWLAGDLALAALWVATVVEIVADKIPVVDHALDAVATVLRPAAAWLGSFAVLSGWPTPWAQLAAIVLGTMAFTVHGLKASLRLGSTVVTLGVGNALLSLLDDVFALLLLAGAVFGSVAVLAAIPTFVWLRSRRRAGAAAAATDSGPAAPLSLAP
ncbi:MAG: DUF4126 domain-containing protein [Candidatus Eisenbacteria bacterium]